MASFASEVSGTQMVEFFGRFGRFGGNMLKLQRLLGDDEFMEWWVRKLEQQPKPIEYRVHVNRGPFPPMPTLEKLFSNCGVSDLFYRKVEWEKHSSRMGENDVTAEEVVMVVKQFSSEEIKEMGGLKSENIIAWGLKNDLVAADEKETCAFGINPETCDLQRKFWWVGLGSSAVAAVGRCVAVLRSLSDRRILGDRWFGCNWFSDDRFLFVRK